MSKRLFDIFITSIILIIIAPVLLIIVIALKIESPGPVLIRQTRLGQNRKPFKLLKFRTMSLNAEQSATGPNIELSRDPRFSRIGLFLRKTSMDEFPSFLNVLCGEMSLVGPLSALPLEENHYSAAELKRFELRPGITGYWQVFSQKDETSFKRMIDMDLEYAKKQSLLLDLNIIFRSAVMGAKGEVGR